MTKAEELAMEAYPNMTFPFTPLDLNAYRREAFIHGYEQAEKDLALTADDIAIIEKLFWEVVPMGREAYYTEVLTRFKKFKEESHD